MSTLVDDLLGEDTFDDLNPSSIEGDKSDVQPPSRVLESIKARIKESKGSITFNEREVSALRNVLRLIEYDPFKSGMDFVMKDLEKLGLRISDNDQIGPIDDDDPDSFEQEYSVGGEVDGDGIDKKSSRPTLFTVDQAIVAPNATPAHDQKIPDSVLHALTDLSGSEDEVKYDEVREPESAEDTSARDMESRASRIVAGDTSGGDVDVREALERSGGHEDAGYYQNLMEGIRKRMKGGK